MIRHGDHRSAAQHLGREARVEACQVSIHGAHHLARRCGRQMQPAVGIRDGQAEADE